MGSYCGYTEAQMLHVLHAQCETVRLEKVNNNNWRLWCLVDGLGEFEMEGTMTYVLMHAFKPHKDWADKRRDDLQAAIKQITDKTQSEEGVVFADTAEDFKAREQTYNHLNCPACGGSGHKDDARGRISTALNIVETDWW